MLSRETSGIINGVCYGQNCLFTRRNLEQSETLLLMTGKVKEEVKGGTEMKEGGGGRVTFYKRSQNVGMSPTAPFKNKLC